MAFAQVITIQSRLFDVGSAVATPLNTASEAKRDRTQFDQAETSRLEGWIDELEEQLPPLTNFILPSGVHNIRGIQSLTDRHGVQQHDTAPLIGSWANIMAVTVSQPCHSASHIYSRHSHMWVPTSHFHWPQIQSSAILRSDSLLHDKLLLALWWSAGL